MPNQAITRFTGPNNQSATANLCHPSSNVRIPVPVFTCSICHIQVSSGTPNRRARCPPSSWRTRRAHRCAGLDDLLHAPQRLVEHEVLHHPQRPPERSAAAIMRSASASVGAIGFCTFTWWPASSAAHTTSAWAGVGTSTSTTIEVGGEELVEIGEPLARRGTPRHVPRVGRRWCRTTRPPVESWVAAVAEDVEVVDAAQADDADSEGAPDSLMAPILS